MKLDPTASAPQPPPLLPKARLHLTTLRALAAGHRERSRATLDLWRNS